MPISLTEVTEINVKRSFVITLTDPGLLSDFLPPLISCLISYPHFGLTISSSSNSKLHYLEFIPAHNQMITEFHAFEVSRYHSVVIFDLDHQPRKYAHCNLSHTMIGAKLLSMNTRLPL